MQYFINNERKKFAIFWKKICRYKVIQFTSCFRNINQSKTGQYTILYSKQQPHEIYSFPQTISEINIEIFVACWGYLYRKKLSVHEGNNI